MATVGWMHQETFVPTGILLHRDTADILTGSFGPKANLRFYPGGRFALDANAEYSFMTGAARGWVREFTLGWATRSKIRSIRSTPPRPTVQSLLGTCVPG
jgi:hypothetical protein